MAMILLLMSLIFCDVVMTQASAGASPLFYLFDVSSSAPEYDVIDPLRANDVRHAFKVVGEDRYLFVVEVSKDDPSLSRIAFPSGAKVTQRPVINLDAFYQMFQVNFTGRFDSDQLFSVGDIVNLISCEYIVPDDMTMEEFAQNIVLAGEYEQMMSRRTRTRPANYAHLNAHPPQFTILTAFDPQLLYPYLLIYFNKLGGPGMVKTVATQLVAI